MTRLQIEMWAQRIIDAVRSNKPHEDSAVELKSEWIDAKKAARLIAGHANAARGEPILWLIGVDEKTGLKGADHKELATWFTQVKSQFESVAPSMMDLNLDMYNVVALLFDTDRAPFVVKNPAFGSGGEKVQFEIPWREGASTRSATRADILRLLSPLQYLPTVEVLGGSLRVSENEQNHPSGPGYQWALSLSFYIVPLNDKRVVMPFHHCHLKISPSLSDDGLDLQDIRLYPDVHPQNRSRGNDNFSHTIIASPSELLINGPGVVSLTANWITPPGELDAPDMNISVDILPAGAERPISFSVKLPKKAKFNEGHLARWALNSLFASSDGRGGVKYERD